MSDPTSPARPTRFKKWALRLFLAGTVLLVAGTLFNITQHFGGRRALARAEADWAAAGLPTYDELFRDDAPVPPDQNLLEVPFFKTWTIPDNAYSAHPDRRYEKWRNDAHLGFSPPKGVKWTPGGKLYAENFFLPQRPNDGGSTSLSPDTPPKLRRVPGRTDTALLAEALEADFPEFKTLRATVESRPAVSLQIKFPKLPRTVLDFENPSFHNTQTGGHLLALYAHAKLAEGEPAPAYAATLATIRYAKALESLPALIPAMTANFLVDACINPLTQAALARHAWTEPELAALDTALRDYHPAAVIDRAIAGDARSSAAYIKNLPNSGGVAYGTYLRQLRLNKAVLNALLLPSPLCPEGWGAANAAARLDTTRDFLLGKGDTPADTLPARIQVLQRQSKAIATPWNALSRFTTSALGNSIGNAACIETQLACARLAIALERHRLAHGQFPASLDALVPAYLPAIPLGAATRVAPRYTPTPAGGFTLTYVGEVLADTAPGKDIEWTCPDDPR